MIYNNSDVRRQDRLMNETRSVEILKNSEFGVLSMIDTEGLPYAIPVNYVWDNCNSVYIHCAMEGKKITALQNNPNISFCVIGNVNLIPDKFTTEYESIILKGKAHLNLSDEEKMKAISLIIAKFSSEYKELGRKYTEKSFHRTNIIRLDFTEFSGKNKIIH